MKIAIDMDNTIVDEFGSTLRPGILQFIKYLSSRHELILWTNSRKVRAYEIIKYFKLREYFNGIITREDYDPTEVGNRKDIKAKGIDVLIDDDPEEIEYVKRKKGIGILVESYRKNKAMNPNEINEIARKYKL